MPNPTRIEINCETGVESIIELTDAEVVQLEKDRVAAEQKKKAEDAAAAALEEQKLVVLKKLGLTADEVTALLS
jgi:hypothetical protein